MLGGGVYLMNRWDAMGGSGKSGAIILIVLGTLILTPFVLMMVVKIALKYWVGKLTKDLGDAFKGLGEPGEQMVAANKAMYEKIHQFRSADEEDFDLVDGEGYAATRKALEGLGFRHLGDVVDETIEELAGLTTVISVMASTNGTTSVGFYEFAAPAMPRGMEGKKLLMCDVSTEFTDKTFLITANTQGLDQTTAVTGIDRRQHPLETSIAELVRMHETEKAKLLVAKSHGGPGLPPAISAVVINTLDDALESEKRQQGLKNEFRKQIGYVDPEEVRRVASTTVEEDGEALGDMAAGAVDAARKKERDRL